MSGAEIYFNAIPPGQDIGALRDQLRPSDKWFLAGDMLPYTMASIGVSKWQWHVQHQGEYVCGFWVIPDGPDGRGLVSMMFGNAVDRLPLRSWCRDPVRNWRAVLGSGAYPSLRAWVDVEDVRAIRFAQFMGLKYDCGPAKGFLPGGQDANLYLWRMQDGQGRIR